MRSIAERTCYRQHGLGVSIQQNNLVTLLQRHKRAPPTSQDRELWNWRIVYQVDLDSMPAKILAGVVRKQ